MHKLNLIKLLFWKDFHVFPLSDKIWLTVCCGICNYQGFTSHFILLQVFEHFDKSRQRVVQIPALIKHLCLHHILMAL